MPLHLLPSHLSRRRFLLSALSSMGAAFGASLRVGAADSSAPSGALLKGRERWALFSDTHIAEDTHFMARGINMADHLMQGVREALAWHAQDPLSGFLVNGDCAYLDGQEGDYRTFASLLRPIAEGRIPIHLTMGNHDHRERLQSGFGAVTGAAGQSTKAIKPALVEGKLASMVRAREIDWFLLDSLDVTNKTPGVLGKAQIEWLDAALAADPARPALVMLHHNPQPVSAPGGKYTGLTDTDGLLRLLEQHRRVKALFFGHTHVFSLEQSKGVHWVNLPACAYRSGLLNPTGWVAFEADAAGASLTLIDVEQKHPKHAQRIDLEWRGA